MATETGGLDPSAAPASASLWALLAGTMQVPCQGHAPDEPSWFFPHRIPLELPLVQGMLWAHVAGSQLTPAAGSVFHAPSALCTNSYLFRSRGSFAPSWF